MSKLTNGEGVTPATPAFWNDSGVTVYYGDRYGGMVTKEHLEILQRWISWSDNDFSPYEAVEAVKALAQQAMSLLNPRGLEAGNFDGLLAVAEVALHAEDSTAINATITTLYRSLIWRPSNLLKAFLWTYSPERDDRFSDPPRTRSEVETAVLTFIRSYLHLLRHSYSESGRETLGLLDYDLRLDCTWTSLGDEVEYEREAGRLHELSCARTEEMRQLHELSSCLVIARAVEKYMTNSVVRDLGELVQTAVNQDTLTSLIEVRTALFLNTCSPPEPPSSLEELD